MNSSFLFLVFLLLLFFFLLFGWCNNRRELEGLPVLEDDFELSEHVSGERVSVRLHPNLQGMASSNSGNDIFESLHIDWVLGELLDIELSFPRVHVLIADFKG